MSLAASLQDFARTMTLADILPYAEWALPALAVAVGLWAMSPGKPPRHLCSGMYRR